MTTVERSWSRRADLVGRATQTRVVKNAAFAIPSAAALRFLITTQAKRNLSSRSGIGGVRSAT